MVNRRVRSLRGVAIVDRLVLRRYGVSSRVTNATEATVRLVPWLPLLLHHPAALNTPAVDQGAKVHIVNLYLWRYEALRAFESSDTSS